MTERENALLVYAHKTPQWIPNLFDSMHYVGIWGGNECGQSGEKISETEALDCFGIPWTFVEGAPMPSTGKEPLEDISEWKEKLTIPDPDTWNWEEKAKIELADYDGTKVLVYFCEEGLFDRLRDVLGFENALCSLLTDPEECAAFFEAIADYKIKIVKNVAKYYKPDVFMLTEDMAKHDGLFMNPEVYRELMKPQHKRIIEAIREEGMIAEVHTCGKCDDIIDDYVEVGVQSFFPAQACNDLVAIKKKHGDKLVISGGFDSQGPAGYMDASEDTMRAEARRMVESYAEGGGYIALPVILGGNNFTLLELDTQKYWYDEFVKLSHEIYK